MTRFQKIAFGIFIVLSMLFAFLGYRSLKNTKQPSVKALSLIPDSCSVLLAFDNYPEFSNSLRNKNLAWQDLRGLSCLAPFEKHFAYFDSLLNLDKEFSELVENNQVYFSLYNSNRFLVTLNLKELAQEKIFADKLLSLFNPSLPLKLTASVRNGVLGISNSTAILEKLNDAKTSRLINNKDFSLLTGSVDYSGTSIYINNSRLLRKTFSSISIKPESISLNGLGLTDSTTFRGDDHSAPLNSFGFLQCVPIICNAFEVFAIQDAASVFSVTQKSDWWDSVNEEALFNSKKQFYDNTGDYIVTSFLPSKNKALILHLRDSVRLAEILPFIKDTSNSAPGVIFQLRHPGSFCSSTFAKLKLQEMRYFTVIADHLIFTADKTDAEIFVNAGSNKSSILQNSAFRAYASKNFDTEFHYLNYFLVNAVAKEQVPFGEFLNDPDVSNLKNISHGSFLSAYKKGLLNYRLNIKYFQEDIVNEPGLLWTLNSDTAIITQPFLFKNHSTGGNEIVFQAGDNHLYLQNATGKTLWKKRISEQVRSEIFIVDAFKNGKYQMLFNTDHLIHLIDRNGNYVQGYPVKLPAKATNKLCVFDYEGRNDLRLFIACSDNRIYNYTIRGIKNEGFKPHVTANEVTLPVKYCKVGLSDYLITADRKGKLYVFSRKGDGRIDFKNKLVEEATGFEIEAGNSTSNTQIVYYDEKTHLIDKISLTDKKEVFKANDCEGKTAYCFNDFDRNKITDLVIACPGRLEAYNINGNKLFSKEIPGAPHPFEVAYHSLGNNTFISVFSKTGSTITLTNIEQQTSMEYPATQAPFICELFNDGKPYLLLASENKIKCYKL